MIAESLHLYFVWIAEFICGSLLITGFQRIVPSRWIQQIKVPQRGPYIFLSVMLILGILIFLLAPPYMPWVSAAGLNEGFPRTYFSKTFMLCRFLFDVGLWGILWRGLQTSRKFMGPLSLIMTLLSGTQFAVDWIQGLVQGWKSTGLGLIFLVSSLLLTFSLRLSLRASSATDQQRLDLGSILFTLIGTWSYLLVMQYIVIWSANLPQEVLWYIDRLKTSWRWAYTYLVLFQVAFPLLLLLHQKIKKSPHWLMGLARITLIGQSLFTILLIEPSLHEPSRAVLIPVVVYASLIGLSWSAISKESSVHAKP